MDVLGDREAFVGFGGLWGEARRGPVGRVRA